MAQSDWLLAKCKQNPPFDWLIFENAATSLPNFEFSVLQAKMDVDAVTLVIIVFVVALTTFVFSVLGKYCGEKFLVSPKRRQRPRSSRIPKCYQCTYGGRDYPSKRFRRRSNDGGVSFAVHRPSASPEEIRLNTMRPAAGGAIAAPGLATTAGNESSQTFVRLGIRASKEGRNILDLEGQLHHDDTSPLTKNRSSEYHLNEIRKSSARKRLSKNITFGDPDQNGGSYSNYEELAEVGQPVRNPGDGQQREEEGGQDHLGQIELTPYEAGKPGFTGHRPLLSAAGAGPSMVMIAYPTEPELETDTRTNLGMPKEQDGDRLTPLSAIFEAQSSSSSFGGTVISSRQAFNDNYLLPNNFDDNLKRSASPRPIQMYELNRDEDFNSPVRFRPSPIGNTPLDASKLLEVGLQQPLPIRWDGKRFSYPRMSKHCKTCACNHHKLDDHSQDLDKDEENIALFESESATKANPTFSESWARPKPRTEQEGQRMQMRLSFKNKEQSEGHQGNSD